MKEGNKYVPKVKSDGNDLVISFPEYEERFPGKIKVLNGATQHKYFQLLLNSAVMEFSDIGKSQRTKRDLQTSASITDEAEINSDWSIAPKAIVTEPGSVFSISQGDFEDGHQMK